MSPADALRARIADLQLAGWARLGVTADVLAARFKSRRQAYRDLAARDPEYLTFDWGIPAADAARHGLAASLDELWALDPPTPYQDPAVYAWLQMAWRYVGLHLPYQSTRVRSVMLASAPTGDFNARAVPHGAAGAVLIEEGLVRLARRLCGLLAPLLFREQDGRLLVRTKLELSQVLADEAAAAEIGQLFIDHFANGDTALPPVQPQASTAVTRAADTLFQIFIAFVIWHEVFHLEVAAGNPETVNREVLVRDAQVMVPQLLAAATAAGLPGDAAMLMSTFRAQREEAEADTYAMIRAAAYGSRTDGLPVTVTGAMASLLTLETLHRMVLATYAPDLAAAEAVSGLDDLRRSGLLAGRPHPHPRVRRAEVVEVIGALDHGVGQLVRFEGERVEQVFAAVWPLLDATIAANREALQRDGDVWLQRAPDQDARMLTALCA